MRLGVLLAAALGFVGAAAQALTPTAQDRHVSGNRHALTQAGESFNTETVSAPDYAPFVALTDGVSLPLLFPLAPIARLSSSIEPERLRATGSTNAFAPNNFIESHSIGSESVYSVTFVLEEERPFTLTGRLDLEVLNFGIVTDTCGSASGRIALTGPSGVVAELAEIQPSFPPWEHPCFEDACVSSLPLSATGVLAPGSYTLEARSDTSSTGGFFPHSKCNVLSISSYDAALRLTSPVPALPLPLAPLLGVALLGAVRRRARR